MNKILTVFVVAIAAGLALYFLLLRDAGPPASVTPPASPADVTPTPDPAEPAIQFPLPQPADDEPVVVPEPLPPLGPDGDMAMQNRLAELVGTERLNEVGLADDFIRRFVVSVDGLTEQKLPVRVRPVKPVPGTFVVSGDEDNPALSPDNYKRYDKLVVTFAAIPTTQIVDIYTRFYPLFQEAYEELGYGDEYFNDRVVEVIDRLLETPSPEGRIELTRPRVMYQFADPELEALSSGQKLLIRIGPGNGKLVRQKLAEIRVALTE